VLRKAATPLAHGVGIFAKQSHELFVLKTIGSQKHNLGPLRQTLRCPPTPHQALQLSTLLARQVNRNSRFAHRSCLQNVARMIQQIARSGH
jgi:hypothetical protein